MHHTSYLSCFKGLLLCLGIMFSIASCGLLPQQEHETTFHKPTPPVPTKKEEVRTLDQSLKAEQGAYKIGSPYEIEGRRYYPKVDYAYDKEGIASWYGSAFAGKRTANGEIFDPEMLTAAHKTLPMPSYVRVTNLENGRSLILRVNDRGPFVGERIIDLSRRAARQLGFLEQGKARVRIQILKDKSLQAAALAGDAIALKTWKESRRQRASTHHALNRQEGNGSQAMSDHGGTLVGRYIQVGAFHDFYHAQRLKLSFSHVVPTDIKETLTKEGDTLYRVRLGPFRDKEQFQTLLQGFIDQGYDDAFVIPAEEEGH
ncbi:MAG: septal ring lytic transglycosylase RlpA family protein [Alphaproteobacteria bacterium GM7ARS4]|nr:septal ring lytic transglycosylase RlpA family protein [Alphaproteobacteria bacterium GM7ARS4]